MSSITSAHTSPEGAGRRRDPTSADRQHRPETYEATRLAGQWAAPSRLDLRAINVDGKVTMTESTVAHDGQDGELLNRPQ